MADILDLVKTQKAQSFAAGETLIHEGLTLGQAFRPCRGSGRGDPARQQVTHVDEPGSVFGEMSVLLDQPYSATVKALSDVRAYVIDDAFGFLKEHPEAALELATLLARRLYYTTAYLVDLQQQAAGRRQDLDVVDRILGAMFQSPGEAAKAGKKKRGS